MIFMGVMRVRTKIENNSPLENGYTDLDLKNICNEFHCHDVIKKL